MSVLLDTHIWVWWLTPQSPLSNSEREALDAAASHGQIHLAAISMWEAQMLHSKGRLDLPVPFREWLKQAAGPQMVKLVPLDLSVILALDELPASFHGDPADRLIAASARAYGLQVATHDARMRRSRAAKFWKPS